MQTTADTTIVNYKMVMDPALTQYDKTASGKLRATKLPWISIARFTDGSVKIHRAAVRGGDVSIDLTESEFAALAEALGYFRPPM